MNILIVGGTGTIGTHLVHSLSKQDCKIFLLSRNPKKYHKKFNQNISLISWNTNNSNLLKDIDILNTDCIVLGCTHYSLVEKQIKQQLSEKNYTGVVLNANKILVNHINNLLM